MPVGVGVVGAHLSWKNHYSGPGTKWESEYIWGAVTALKDPITEAHPLMTSQQKTYPTKHKREPDILCMYTVKNRPESWKMGMNWKNMSESENILESEKYPWIW